MKRWFSLCVLFLTISTAITAKDFDILSVEYIAQINLDGSVNVTEYRTYYFEGSFSWADRSIVYENAERISNISIREAGVSYRESDSEDPLTYQLSSVEDGENIKWFYEARDTTKTFILNYTLHGALTIGPAWAEFDRTIVSDVWKEDTEYLEGEIAFAYEKTAGDLYAWLYGYSDTILETERDKLIITSEYIDSRNDLRVRLLFPASYVPQAGVTDAGFTLEQVKKEEEERQKQLAIEREKAEERRKLANMLIPIICILSIGLTISMYLRYRPKEARNPMGVNESEHGFPSQHRPALISYLVNRTITGPLLMSTLIDLGQRGHLTIKNVEPEKKEKKWWEGEDKTGDLEVHFKESGSDNLEPFERHLITFIKEQQEKGESTLKALFKSSTKESQKWYSEWNKEIKSAVKEEKWYNPDSKKGAYTNGAVQVCLLLVSLVFLAWASVIALIPLVITVVAIVASVAIYQHTPLGEAVYQRWKTVRKELKKQPESVAHKYSDVGVLVYGMALGVPKEKIGAALEAKDVTMSDRLSMLFDTGENLEYQVNELLAFTYAVVLIPGADGSGAAGVAGGGAAGAGGGGAG